MKKASNVSVIELRKILKAYGLRKIRTNGGHEIWAKDGLSRPVTFQTHIEPVPEFIIQQIISILNTTKKEFLSGL